MMIKLCWKINKINPIVIYGHLQGIHSTSCAQNSNSKWYEDGIYRSIYDDVPLPNKDLCSLLFPRFEKWSDKIALECLGSGQKLTYGQLLDASMRWGSVLKKMETRPDEVTYWNKPVRIPPRVSIFAPNVMEYPPVLFGSLAAGFCFTTISSNYKVGEAVNSLKDTKPEVLVVHPTLEHIADEALRQCKMTIPVFTIGSSSSGKPNIKDILYDKNDFEKFEIEKMNHSDIALILYSGGTTGLPKGVSIPHKSLVNNLVMFTDPRIYAYGPDTEYHHETVMGLMPFYHSYGMGVIIIFNLYLGSKILVWEKFDPNIFGKIVKDNQIYSMQDINYT